MEAAAQDLLAAATDVDGVVESEAKEHQGSSMHGSLEKGEGGGGVAADPEMSNLPTTSANKETKNRQSVAAGAACGGAEEDSGTTGSSGYLDVVVVPKQRKRNCDSLAASDSAASLGGGGGGEGEEEAAAAVSQQQQQHVLCRLCKRGFSSGAALRGHYLRAHGGGSPSAAAMEDGNARTSNSENGGDKEQQLSSWTTGRGTYLVKNPVASHIHSTGSDLDSCRDDESSPSLASSRPPPPPPPRGARVSCSGSEAGRLTKKKKRGEVAAAQAESSSPMYQEQQEDEEDMEAEEDQEEEEATSVLLGSSSSQATNNMQEVDMEEVTEGTSYMCQICEEEFETAKELNLHKNEHPQYILRMNPKRSQRFIDQDCSDLLGGAAVAAGPTHHHHHHHNHQSKKAAPVSSGKSEDKLISCTECNKKFGSMKALFGHMRCHPERYWRGIQPPDRSTLAQDHAAAAAVAHTHHGSYRRKKRSPPIVLPKADPESESEMNSKQADAAGKASEVDDSDTESIEAAYINGSSSGRHNNSGPAGGWRTKKRTKRVRQMVRSLQAVAGSAAAAGAPQEEEEEEEESPSTPPTEDTQVQKDIVFALMLLHPQRIAELNPPFLEHKLSKDKDPLMDINVPEKFKGKDNENAGYHETEKHHHHHYREADSKVKKMQQAEVAGGGEDGVVVSNNNQDLDELETQGEQGGGTKMMYQCATCKRIFKSHQALGGHRASHKKVKGCFARTSINDEEGSGRQDQSPEDDENKEGISPDEDFVKVEEQNLPLEPQDQSHISVEDAEPCDYLVVAKGDNEEMLNAARKTKGHECSICHRVFNSGQALGGHKRCHWGGAATAGSNEATTTTHNINNKNAMVMATVEQLGLQGFHPIQGLQSVPEKKGIMLEGILDLNMPAPECAEEMVEEQVASASGIMAPISQHSYLPFPTFAIDSAVSINNQHPFSDLVVKGTKHMKFQGESLVNQVEKNLEPVASGTSDTVGFRTGDKTKDQEMNHFSSICDRSFTSLEHLSTHQKPHAAIMGPVPGLTV
ncbi:hypothetical protein CY35_02G088700 [Sphagnum magellanicum]|nr:hypothetical protein CY35_02G088700 [Sphagnum magellanicum]